MNREDVNGAVTHRYVHRDHLGSITALTDEATGTVVARYSYDAWGLRRNPTTWQPGPITSFERLNLRLLYSTQLLQQLALGYVLSDPCWINWRDFSENW